MEVGPCTEPSIQFKQEISKSTTLTLYDPEAQMGVSADASSSYSLGAILLQQVGTNWKPIAYALRSMSDTECQYTQIEKEALATTWTCEKFSNFIPGKRFEVRPQIPRVAFGS